VLNNLYDKILGKNAVKRGTVFFLHFYRIKCKNTVQRHDKIVVLNLSSLNPCDPSLKPSKRVTNLSCDFCLSYVTTHIVKWWQNGLW